jgi:hypothetical protein
MSVSIKITHDTKEIDRLLKSCKGEHVRIVADGVEYGVYQEFGTRRLAAHPFFTPAAEVIRPRLIEAFRQVTNWEQGEMVIEKLAREFESIAKQNAPVDTGALRSSIHVEKP